MRTLPGTDRYTILSLFLALTLLPGLTLAAAASDLITGAVENKTRNQPASGDPVILLRLDQGMQEEARTTTDDMGAFTLKVQVPDKPHLVRVIHQGVNYDRQVAPGDSLTLDVFDAAPRVQGISGGIEIIRTGTKGNVLHVSDMMEIKNDSSPPLTQASERTLDVYLRADAKIDSVMAATSGKIGVLITATPARGEPGHYTVNFPLRPGSTKFAFNYDIPYTGHAAFHTRLAYPMQQLAVMFPPTMKFESRSPAFQLLPTQAKDFRVEAANQVQAGYGPSFEISGAGAQPQLQARIQEPVASPAVQPPVAAQPPVSTAANSRTPEPAARNDSRDAPPALASSGPVNEWWILGAATLLVLGACGVLIWRRPRPSAATVEMQRKPSRFATAAGDGASSPLLDAIKQQLLELETSRLDGSISREEYDAAKQALDGTFKRALARSGTKS